MSNIDARKRSVIYQQEPCVTPCNSIITIYSSLLCTIAHATQVAISGSGWLPIPTAYFATWEVSVQVGMSVMHIDMAFIDQCLHSIHHRPTTVFNETFLHESCLDIFFPLFKVLFIYIGYRLQWGLWNCKLPFKYVLSLVLKVILRKLMIF